MEVVFWSLVIVPGDRDAMSTFIMWKELEQVSVFGCWNCGCTILHLSADIFTTVLLTKFKKVTLSTHSRSVYKVPGNQYYLSLDSRNIILNKREKSLSSQNFRIPDASQFYTLHTIHQQILLTAFKNISWKCPLLLTPLLTANALVQSTIMSQ
jgi:hypothetical protein